MKITDKMRLDWIARRPSDSGSLIHRNRQEFIVWQDALVDNAGRGKTLRLAIDAAIRAQEKKR